MTPPGRTSTICSSTASTGLHRNWSFAAGRGKQSHDRRRGRLGGARPDRRVGCSCRTCVTGRRHWPAPASARFIWTADGLPIARRGSRPRPADRRHLTPARPRPTGRPVPLPCGPHLPPASRSAPTGPRRSITPSTGPPAARASCPSARRSSWPRGPSASSPGTRPTAGAANCPDVRPTSPPITPAASPATRSCRSSSSPPRARAMLIASSTSAGSRRWTPRSCT